MGTHLQVYFTGRKISTRLFASILLLVTFSLTGNAFGQSVADLIDLNPEREVHIRQLPDLMIAEQRDQSAATETETGTESEIEFEGRVVVITFFASWCPPCREEFKALNVVSREIGSDNLTVVAINVFEEFDGNDEARMEKFLRDTQPEFNVFEGNENTRELFGGIKRIPTLLVFDRVGNLAFDFVHKRGAKKQTVDASELSGAIQPLL